MDITVIVVLLVCTLAAALAIGSRLSHARKAEKASQPSAVSETRHEVYATHPRGTDPEAVYPITQPVQDNR